MAEGDITVYNNYKEAIFNGTAPDLDTDTIKIALVAAHTPDIDLHDFFDDVSADEVAGTGYTAGGETLSVTVSQDDTDDEGVFDALDVTWTGLDAGTPSHGIIYHDTGTPSTSTLICYIELGTASNGGDYTVSWNAEGILNAT